MHESKRKARGIYDEYAQANYQFHISLSPSSFAFVAVSSRKKEGSLSSDILSISAEKDNTE